MAWTRPVARRAALGSTIAVFAFALAGCGSGDDSASPSVSSSARSSASPHASASAGNSGTVSNDPLVNEAIASYKEYVIAQVGETKTKTKEFTDAVRAGDVELAQSLFAPSRQGWERIEPIAGLVDVLDGRLDARVDDFENESDPEFTGWHRIEYHLWELSSTDGTKEFADQLDADLVTLDEEIRALTFPALEVTLGPGELVEEVSKGKITGEEDRYSGTDLWDFGANIEGSKKLFELLTPALEKKDPALVDTIGPQFEAVETSLAEYRNPDGSYKPYSELAADDKTRMQAELGTLAESLSLIPGTLGLR